MIPHTNKFVVFLTQQDEIFDLEEVDLKRIGFGAKQSKNICTALKDIEASKSQILSCLGIDGFELFIENL